MCHNWMLMSGARLSIPEQFEAEWGDSAEDKSDYFREHDNTKLVLYDSPAGLVDDKEVRSWIGKEHKQIVKFASRWVAAIRSLLRAWEAGDEKGKARRLSLLQACRNAAASEEAAALIEQNTPWYVFLSLMSENSETIMLEFDYNHSDC